MDSGPVQPKVGPVLDFGFVEECLLEVKRAARGGADGCRHALQVLHALKGYLDERALTGMDPAERLLLRHIVAGARSGLRIENGDEDLFLRVLVDLEQMTVCDARDQEVAVDVAVDDMCEPDEAADGPVAMVAEASSVTVVCAACGSVILERRMDAHIRFWCSRM